MSLRALRERLTPGPMTPMTHDTKHGVIAKPLKNHELDPVDPIDPLKPRSAHDWRYDRELSEALAHAARDLPITSQEIYEVLVPEYIDARRGDRINADHLRALALMLHDGIERSAGRVPQHETAAIHCRHCGPVWAAPDIAEYLPVDSSWPRALGCPWCLPKSRSFPRPSVRCESCRYFRRDTINPPAGLGSCSAGHGVYYPKQAHVCLYFQPDISEG